MTESFVPEKALILPIDEASVDELRSLEDPSAWVECAEAGGLAAALLVQKIPLMLKKRQLITPQLERALSDVIASVVTEHDLQLLRRTVCDTWSNPAFEEGVRYLEIAGIGLATTAEVEGREYITANKTWDFTFSKRAIEARNPFSSEVETEFGEVLRQTDPQARSLRTFMAQRDESLAVQGYSGTGKTHFARALISLLNPASTVLLAMTAPQLDALKQRLGNPRVICRTFGHLAAEMLETQMLGGIWARRTSQKYQLNDHAISKGLRFGMVGRMPAETVANICRRTVISFCNSSDAYIKSSHLPQIADNLSPADTAVLIEYANRYWAETAAPSSKEFELPLRSYHRIKMVSLAGYQVPPQYSHVIADEAHDIPAPLLEVLDQSPQAVITLGDKFQRLTGWAPTRKQIVRRQELNLTIRAGQQVEEVFNPMIEAHPSPAETPLIGSRLKRTHIVYYDKVKTPSSPTTILVGTPWHLLEWFQRLAHEKVRFALLPGSMAHFRDFVEGCIGLYHFQIRSNYSYLFRYPTWDSLASENSGNSAFRRIEAMLARGYGYKELEQNIASMATPGKARTLLGKVDDARNMEFDSVMLAPELLSEVNTGKKPTNARVFAEAVSRLYLGASRAKNELILPGFMKGWLQDNAISPLEITPSG